MNMTMMCPIILYEVCFRLSMNEFIHLSEFRFGSDLRNLNSDSFHMSMSYKEAHHSFGMRMTMTLTLSLSSFQRRGKTEDEEWEGVIII